MMVSMKPVTKQQKIRNFISSRKFFYVILAIFLVSTIWFALTSRFPMAFDENYHYGIIQHYAQQWSPFFSSPPAHSEALGDVTRYPSYLYHYLMSFPYRLISLFVHTDGIKIIILRFINIGMFVGALLLFKKLLQEARVSDAVSNVVLLLFVLTPTVPFLAAQISYDNLLVLTSTLLLYLLLRYMRHAREGQLRIDLLLIVIILCLLASIIQYSFLPIFFAVFLYLSFYTLHFLRHQKDTITRQLYKSFAVITPRLKIVLGVLLLLSVGMFAERYAVSIVNFKTPIPACDQVVSTESCLQYGPYARDSKLKAQKEDGPAHWSVAKYSSYWVGQTVHELFFAITYSYENDPPLPIIYTTAWVVGALGIALVVLQMKKILKNQAFGMMGFISVFYIVVLLVYNHQSYVELHWPVAIHGRYLVPLLPLMYTILAYGFLYSSQLLKQYKLSAQIITIFIVVALFTQGGGALSYLVRSDQSWDWQNTHVVKVNNAARSVARKLIVH